MGQGLRRNKGLNSLPSPHTEQTREQLERVRGVSLHKHTLGSGGREKGHQELRWGVAGTQTMRNGPGQGDLPSLFTLSANAGFGFIYKDKSRSNTLFL